MPKILAMEIPGTVSEMRFLASRQLHLGEIKSIQNIRPISLGKVPN